MAFLSPKERADVYLLESVNLCLERRTKKLVSQYFTRAVIQSVFLSSTCLHKSKHEKLGERANSFEYYISGRQMGGFFLYACFGTNINTFQREISSQTVKSIKIIFRHHLGFCMFPHWQDHLGKLFALKELHS